MKKFLSFMLTLVIVFSSLTVSFADSGSCEKASDLFIETVDACFSENALSEVYDREGTDITDMFHEEFLETYNNRDYEKIWAFAKANVSSISIITREEPEKDDPQIEFCKSPGSVEPQVSTKTIKVNEWKYFLDKNIRSAGQITNLEYKIVVKGRYTENVNTGKILSANVDAVTMEYTSPGSGWDISWTPTMAKAIKGVYDVTFIGQIKYTAVFSYGIAIGKPYESGYKTFEFTKSAE